MRSPFSFFSAIFCTLQLNVVDSAVHVKDGSTNDGGDGVKFGPDDIPGYETFEDAKCDMDESILWHNSKSIATAYCNNHTECTMIFDEDCDGIKIGTCSGGIETSDDDCDGIKIGTCSGGIETS